MFEMICFYSEKVSNFSVGRDERNVTNISGEHNQASEGILHNNVWVHNTQPSSRFRGCESSRVIQLFSGYSEK
jgi:hypothetical protein